MGTEVPLGAFTNLLNTLAGRAAQEADALAVESDERASSYLLDSEGRFLCDPAVPAQRADVLLQLLEREEESLSSSEEGTEPDLQGYALESWGEPFQEDLEGEWQEEW
jgi:hypothetical protein